MTETRCTGLTAAWCPIHGDCTCRRDRDGDDGCPLHRWDSLHPFGESEADAVDVSGRLVLSLFPGIGLLDMAFEAEGFCVVRGPDLLWGGDIRRFHPPAGRFDGVIGGPPCQIFSALKRLNPAAGEKHGNLIPEFERAVSEALPDWFLMENVPGAPEPVVAGYGVDSQLVRDDWVGGSTMRLRRFSLGTRGAARRLEIEWLALHATEPDPAVTGGSRRVPVAIGGSGKIKKRPVKAGVSRVGPHNGERCSIHEMLVSQGAPTDLFDDSPFSAAATRQMIGNGVPLPMGRAVARAVVAALRGEG